MEVDWIVRTALSGIAALALAGCVETRKADTFEAQSHYNRQSFMQQQYNYGLNSSGQPRYWAKEEKYILPQYRRSSPSKCR